MLASLNHPGIAGIHGLEEQDGIKALVLELVEGPTPADRIAQAFELNKDTEAVPVRQVSRDAGTDLHWSGDGERLHWVIGPNYFTRELSDVFAFLPGAPEDLPEPDENGLRVGLEVASDVPTGRVALTGARIVTMNGNEAIEKGSVVVNGNRIEAVGADVIVPDDAAVIDASGRTIVPGYVDAHAHGVHFGSGPGPQQDWAYFANLAYGVTTNHDPSATTGFVFGQAERVRAGRTVGPRIFSTGTILYGADGDTRAVVNGLDDARSHVRRMKAVGAFSVKSYNQPRRDQRQQVLQAARELEMLVVPEGGSTFYHNVTMILDGHTGIEHNIPVAPLYGDVMNLWRETRVGYTPTLVVNYGGLSGEYWWYQHDRVWENDRLLTFVPRSAVDPRARRRVMALGQVGTQIDGFPHQSIGNSLYNCFQMDAIATRTGFSKLGIENAGGLFTRGILLDVAGLRDVEMLGDRYEITVQDLQDVLARQNLTLERGDAVIINTGFGRLWGIDNARYYRTQPGLGVEAAEWLAEQEPMIVGSDSCCIEVNPNPDPNLSSPVHQILLVAHGIYLIESLKLDELVERNVYEFAFIVQPLKLRGATGSSVAPIAVR